MTSWPTQAKGNSCQVRRLIRKFSGITSYFRPVTNIDSSLFFSMPHNCRTLRGVPQAVRDQNRGEFVRRQKVQLENACRRVKRVFWRDDGCALDWELDKEKGVYREYWPSGRRDDLWATRAVARWRAQEPGRIVLSVTPQPDVLEIAWKKAETVPPANVAEHVQSPSTETDVDAGTTNPETFLHADSQTSKRIEVSVKISSTG
jgi:hypothetical protein